MCLLWFSYSIFIFMYPSTLLALVTVGISIGAFYNRQILGKFIMSPYAVIHEKEWYRVVTHAFIHANWAHLIFNMIALWSFGIAVEYYFSTITDKPQIHLYLMYFGAIIFSSIPDLTKKKNNPNYLSLGASGGVSAIVFAAIFFDPWRLIYVFFLPCPGIVFGVLYLIYSSYQSKKASDNINHDAHFYGAIFGLAYPLLIEPSIFQYFIYQLTHPSF